MKRNRKLKKQRPIGIITITQDPIKAEEFKKLWQSMGTTQFVPMTSPSSVEFIGFNKRPRIVNIPKACKEASKLTLYPSQYEYRKITGHSTPIEMMAYDAGRDDEQKVLITWIEKWEGTTNSVFGELLNKKFKQLYDRKQTTIQSNEDQDS